MDTEQLIRTLAEDASPVRRLASPLRRTIKWVSISLAASAVLVFAVGLRTDIATKLADVRFLTESAAALLTSALAAAAAFSAVTPGRPLWERLLPLPALAFWLTGLGQGCWQSWLGAGTGGLDLKPDLL